MTEYYCKRKGVIFLGGRELAGQVKYYGNGDVRSSVEYWQESGINHLMVKKESRIPLMDVYGNPIKRNFQQLTSLQKEYEVKFHLHPFDMRVGKYRLTASSMLTQGKLAQILINFDKFVRGYGLYPLITVHPPHMKYPDRLQIHGISEEDALSNSREFYRSMLKGIQSRIAIENMHDPDRNKNGHELLGFRAEHFTKLIGSNGNGRLGLCIDIGHSLLADESLEKLLELPYEIFSVHFHSNNQTDDQHLLPTPNNVGNLELVREAIRRCTGPVVLETRNQNTMAEVRECVDFCHELME